MEERVARVESTGLKLEAKHLYRSDLPAVVPGEHYWIVAGMWKIDPESWCSGKQVHLDLENMVSIDGPGCFHCGVAWSKDVGPCPGDTCR